MHMSLLVAHSYLTNWNSSYGHLCKFQFLQKWPATVALCSSLNCFPITESLYTFMLHVNSWRLAARIFVICRKSASLWPGLFLIIVYIPQKIQDTSEKGYGTFHKWLYSRKCWLWSFHDSQRRCKRYSCVDLQLYSQPFVEIFINFSDCDIWR